MNATGKLANGGHLTFGKSHTFILDGQKALHKRRFFAREFDVEKYNEGQVNFMQATALAIICGFMGELLKWFESERGWKEGNFTV